MKDYDDGMIIHSGCFMLQKDSGMGSVMHNYHQRETLLTRIVATRNTIYALTQMDLAWNQIMN